MRWSELEIVPILTKPNTVTCVCSVLLAICGSLEFADVLIDLRLFFFNSVVLAIRGSFEFADVLTDLVAAAVEVL